MNKEVQHIVRGCLLALLVAVAFQLAPYFYHYSGNASPVDDSNAIIIDNNETSSEPVVSGSGSPGYILFQSNCASCHQVNKRLVGPALNGVEQRGPWSDRKQVYAWIHNPARYMKADPYTAGLFKEYNGIMMQAFPGLPEKDIDAILDYIKTVSYSHFDVIACR